MVAPRGGVRLSDGDLQSSDGGLDVLDLVPEPCFNGPDYDIGVRDPLRTLLSCSGFGQLLWTPEALFRRDGELGEGSSSEWNRNRTIRAKVNLDPGEGTDTEWFDVVTPQQFMFLPPYHKPICSFIRHGRNSTIVQPAPGEIWSLNINDIDRVIRDRS